MAISPRLATSRLSIGTGVPPRIAPNGVRSYTPERGKLSRCAQSGYHHDAAANRYHTPQGVTEMTAASATPSPEDLTRMAIELRNWGRWGDNDERGALNLITGSKRSEAAALVQEGVSVSCSRPLPVTPTPQNQRPVQHLMISGGDTVSEDSRFGIAADYFAIASHGTATTHLDALCHIFYEGKIYNGYDKSEVRSDGAKKNSIMAGADGIVSRGVLLDIPPVRETQWLEPNERISVAELEKAEERQGLKVGSGDILLVATGRDPREEARNQGEPFDGLAGLDASCLPWIHEREVAVIGCDGVTDALPSGVEGWPMPFHQVAIANMGIHLIDNLHIERLVTACNKRNRWEFLFALAPLRLEGGTASPLNPLAIF
ncbi:MAG TPA: cyclase [Dehalococcoidia bacterium]|nr:cyclase [Dehalococcoidia bacterium]